jgi:Domain of unknown function (DUF4389)
MSQTHQPDETDPSAQAAGWAAAGWAPPGQDQTAAFGQAPGYAAPSGWTLADIPSPVMVSFADPAPQSRLTVLFRIFMAIPHLAVLYIVNFALEIVAVIGWFAALFTGALPEWAHTFIAGVVRWQTRVAAYVFLLTDAYPPFSLDDAAYPVRLVTRPTRLSRLAVFFRIILAIPVALISGLAAFGFLILSFVGWLITLVTGQLPTALHQAGAAIVRYQARYSGYFFMVTSDYPKGLYGDPPAAEAASSAGSWRLVLSSSAKTLVSLALVLGVASTVAYTVLVAVSASSSPGVTNAIALARVVQSNNELATTTDGFTAAVSACNAQLACVTVEDRKLGAALETFASAVRSISFSSSAAAPAAKLVSASTAAAQDLNQLGAATSASQYQSLASTGHAQQDLDNVSADYDTLVRVLQAS